MMEIKDPAIKLFGKTIPVAGDADAADDSSPRLSNASSNFSADKELAEEEAMDTEPQTDHDPDESPTQDESGDPPIAQETDDDHPLKSGAESDKDSPDSHQKDDEKESNDPKNPQQKTIKKPDKILPCPRCNSMDTKFCYYNNYNINQPRHFCKSCQRYWTAGGTMRNVPVGAGRRKNKSSSSARYCHITVSEALQAARSLDVVVPNGAHHGHRPNGTVLTFGTESPLCESMVSVLNIADKKVVLNGINGVTTAPRNGFKENGGDDRSSGSTVTTTSSMDEGAKRGPQDPPPMKQSLNGFPTPTTTTATTTAAAVTPQMPCFQWPYMWNPAAVPVPPFCPVPFYPAPYWNGAAAIPWNIPWVAPPPCQTSPGSNPNSPTLGKHSRDGEILENGEKGAPTVLVPKTLRIDDPDEAAKSSIWTTLGIKKEKGNPTATNISTTTTTASKGAGAGFFNTLHSSKKGDQDKDHKKEASPALMKANPAALCRSISFQESA